MCKGIRQKCFFFSTSSSFLFSPSSCFIVFFIYVRWSSRADKTQQHTYIRIHSPKSNVIIFFLSSVISFCAFVHFPLFLIVDQKRYMFYTYLLHLRFSFFVVVAFLIEKYEIFVVHSPTLLARCIFLFFHWEYARDLRVCVWFAFKCPHIWNSSCASAFFINHFNI